jgi:predicted AlkP superfamily pyrophosphatase or phosphodiesterase
MKTNQILSISTFTFVFAVFLMFGACEKEKISKQAYKTQNVFVIVVDGARFSETWGYSTRQFIPYRSKMLKEGVFCSNFYNNGTTFTCSGHQAMCTGVYESINNAGTQLPTNPSVFQYWLQKSKSPNIQSWVIASKDKLEILSDCVDPLWNGKFKPSTDCGVNGLFTGYREDSVTFNHLKTIIQNNAVKLAIVNFKQPDVAGHAADSIAYLQGILDTDKYIHDFWKMLQNNPKYKNKTTLIVTNDHGRHSAGHADGYISHGDLCEGCRHIEFFAIGPDFKKNYTCETYYEQVDIANTVAELLNFKVPTSTGRVMKDVFRY